MFGEDVLSLTDELEIITEGNIDVYYLNVRESNDTLELIETILKSLGMEYVPERSCSTSTSKTEDSYHPEAFWAEIRSQNHCRDFSALPLYDVVVGVGEEEGVDSLREVTSVYMESLLFSDESLSTFYLILPKNFKNRVQNAEEVSAYIVGSRRRGKKHELKMENIDICCNVNITPLVPLPKNIVNLNMVLEVLFSQPNESALNPFWFKKSALVSETIYKVVGEEIPKKMRNTENYRGVVDENFAFGFKPEKTHRYYVPVEELIRELLNEYEREEEHQVFSLTNKSYFSKDDTVKLIFIDGGGKYGWNVLRAMDVNS